MGIGDYIEVFDKESKIFLLSGIIKKVTDNPKGYSVDGLLFFNPNSDKFEIRQHEVVSLIDSVINILEIEQNSKYIIAKDTNLDNSFEYDFFKWNEIEPEVKKIVELLNQIAGIETYSSCSGHGKIPPYVDFYIKDINKFYDLLDFLRDNEQPSQTYKHQNIDTKHRFIMGVEGRGTCHLESLEINSDFHELCVVLNKYIRS